MLCLAAARDVLGAKGDGERERDRGENEGEMVKNCGVFTLRESRRDGAREACRLRYCAIPWRDLAGGAVEELGGDVMAFELEAARRRFDAKVSRSSSGLHSTGC